MIFRKKKRVPTPVAIAAKEEDVRQERGKVASGLVELDRARLRLEELMASMISETHKGRGNG